MPEAPNPIDIQVGARVRAHREAAGLSQHELSRLIDISFQQIQKYERGQNRISASRLLQIAEQLGVSGAVLLGETAGPNADHPATLLKTPGALELLTAYKGIRSAAHRQGLVAMAKALDAGKSD
ncbi:helix-turn-helix domain-containing protein [Brevundimonas sp. NPDC090276]|uniref:helix-turn-helix domain-containing protein n=1 Tax=Brevundimonas sp. NPDC090276 TaxID=3363956 RepID=UPI003839F0A7